MKRVLIAAAIAALAGCSTVEHAPAVQDAAAKKFESQPNKATVYVVQTGGWFPGYDLVQTFINAQPLGALAAHTYHVTSVDPGAYVVIGMSRENQQSVPIKAEAGKSYFVGMSARMGWNHARVAVYPMPEVEGQAAVREATLAKGFAN